MDTRITKTAYSPAEVAGELGIGLTKTRALIAAGMIPSFKIGKLIRVPSDALSAFVEASMDRQRVSGPAA